MPSDESSGEEPCGDHELGGPTFDAMDLANADRYHVDIYIESLTGSVFLLAVNPFDCIKVIKGKIARYEGVPVAQQHLIWQDKELADEKSLYDYYIPNGATLKLILGMRGGPINTRAGLTSSSSIKLFHLHIYECKVITEELQDMIDADELFDQFSPGTPGDQILNSVLCGTATPLSMLEAEGVPDPSASDGELGSKQYPGGSHANNISPALPRSASTQQPFYVVYRDGDRWSAYKVECGPASALADDADVSAAHAAAAARCSSALSVSEQYAALPDTGESPLGALAAESRLSGDCLPGFKNNSSSPTERGVHTVLCGSSTPPLHPHSTDLYTSLPVTHATSRGTMFSRVTSVNLDDPSFLSNGATSVTDRHRNSQMQAISRAARDEESRLETNRKTKLKVAELKRQLKRSRHQYKRERHHSTGPSHPLPPPSVSSSRLSHFSDSDHPGTAAAAGATSNKEISDTVSLIKRATLAESDLMLSDARLLERANQTLTGSFRVPSRSAPLARLSRSPTGVSGGGPAGTAPPLPSDLNYSRIDGASRQAEYTLIASSRVDLRNDSSLMRSERTASKLNNLVSKEDSKLKNLTEELSINTSNSPRGVVPYYQQEPGSPTKVAQSRYRLENLQCIKEKHSCDEHKRDCKESCAATDGGSNFGNGGEFHEENREAAENGGDSRVPVNPGRMEKASREKVSTVKFMPQPPSSSKDGASEGFKRKNMEPGRTSHENTSKTAKLTHVPHPPTQPKPANTTGETVLSSVNETASKSEEQQAAAVVAASQPKRSKPLHPHPPPKHLQQVQTKGYSKGQHHHGARRGPPATATHNAGFDHFQFKSLTSSEARMMNGLIRQSMLEHFASAAVQRPSPYGIDPSLAARLAAAMSGGEGSRHTAQPSTETLLRRTANQRSHQIPLHNHHHQAAHLDSGDRRMGTPKLPTIASKDGLVSSGGNAAKRGAAVKSHKRCLICRKKTGLTSSYDCRCGGNFCATHRYAEAHQCTFDYKSEGRRALEQANPVVNAPKLPKI